MQTRCVTYRLESATFKRGQWQTERFEISTALELIKLPIPASPKDVTAALINATAVAKLLAVADRPDTADFDAGVQAEAKHEFEISVSAPPVSLLFPNAFQNIVAFLLGGEITASSPRK